MSLRQEVRKLLIAAKVMQMSADIFAVFGIFLFIYIYLTQYQDNAYAALSDPSFIITVLIPFVPAAVLAFIASSKRKKIRVMLEEKAKEA